MTAASRPRPAFAAGSAGRVAYVPFERTTLDGVREFPEERL
jgi:hypothetical protein